MAKRLQKEYAKVVEEGGRLPTYRDISMDEVNMLKWTALMVPANAPYNTGAFKLNIEFPENYPFKPPKVTFSTKIFHPNVDGENGSICVAALKDAEWRPTTQMVDVLSVIANLIEEPNAADPLNNEAAGLYQQDRAKFNKTAEEWVKKHAEKRPR